MKRSIWKFALGGLIVALAMAVISPLASSHPDGLERVLEDHGPAAQDEAEEAAPAAPMPDYMAPGVASESTATILAGLTGTIVVLGVACGLGVLIHRRGKSSAEGDPA